MGKEQILYRFKTEKELILEFGDDWRKETNWRNRDDSLLGMVYPFITYKEERKTIHYLTQVLFENMLIDVTDELLRKYKVQSLIKKLSNGRKISEMGTME